MCIVFLLDRSTFTLGSRNDLSRQTIHHGLFTTHAGVLDQPLDAQVDLTLRTDLNRHLESSTTHTAAFYFHGRSKVRDSAFPYFQTGFSGLLFNELDSVVENVIRSAFLATFHQVVHKLRYQRIVELGIGKGVSLARC